MSSLFTSIEYWLGEHDTDDDEPSDQDGDAKGSHFVAVAMPGNQILSSSAKLSSGNKLVDVGDKMLSMLSNFDKILRNWCISASISDNFSHYFRVYLNNKCKNRIICWT